MPGHSIPYNPKEGKYREELRKEAQKQANKKVEEANKVIQQYTPHQAQTQVTETPEQVNARIAQTIAQRQQRENEARKQEELYARSGIQNAQGFSPEQARAMQYEAHKGIQREAQAAQRNILGVQSQRGIGGRSGIGYAQQRDLNRGYAVQHGQAKRDFDRLNAEQALANFGAEYAAGRGEQSRMATDWEAELGREERKKNRESNPNYAKEHYQQFMRM